MEDNIKKEIENRRTFAIISHPDAGKTTLTEKFLLYGGAINRTCREYPSEHPCGRNIQKHKRRIIVRCYPD